MTTILDFIRLTISMAIFVQGYLSQPARALRHPGVEPAVTSIVEPFFNFTLMFVILTMLFALAIRKAKGLWSKPRPEWAYPGVTFVQTTHYPPGQVPVGMMPGQPQYMQPQYMQQQPMQQQPMQGVPAYLQVAQQQQQAQGQQGYYYYPQQQQPQQMQQPHQQQQQPQPPQPVYQQQQTQEQPKTTENP